MAAGFDVISTAAITSGGPTQTFTFSGIGTFKAAIIQVTTATADSTFTAHAEISRGFVDSNGGNACVDARSLDGEVNTQKSNTYLSDATHCVLLMDKTTSANPAVIAAAEYSSSGTDSLTLNWSTIPDAAYIVTIFAWGGSDVSSIIGKIENGDASGTETTTFQPDQGFVLGSFFGGTSSDPVEGNGFSTTFGMFSRTPGNQATLGMTASDAANVSNAQHLGATDRGGLNMSVPTGPPPGADTGTSNELQITAINATDFDWSKTAGTTSTFYYLVLNYGGAMVFHLEQESTPGGAAPQNMSLTGSSFTPIGAIGMASRMTVVEQALNTKITDADAGVTALCGFTGSTERSVAVMIEDGISVGNPTPVTNTKSYVSPKALVIPEHDGTLTDGAAVEATLSSFNSNGFTLSCSKTNTTTAMTTVWAYFGLEDITEVVDETVQVSESVVFSGTDVATSNDTVQISEGVLAQTANALFVEPEYGISYPTVERASSSAGGTEAADFSQD